MICCCLEVYSCRPSNCNFKSTIQMKEETIFHKIINKEIPADILYEDEQVIAFRDIAPAGPVHVLIVPKQTIPTISDVSVEDEQLIGHMHIVAVKVAEKLGVSEDGYRLVINCGENGGQTVFQLHLHLIGGRKMEWPPG